MKIQVKIGDIFLIPLDQSRRAIGQVISAWKEEIYVAIFDKPLEKTEIVSQSNLETRKPIIFALTLDAKFFHADWPIIDNRQESLWQFPQANYKVRRDGQLYLISRDRSFSRPVTESEAELLQYRSVTSPALLERAVLSYFGLCDWMINFDKLKAEYAYVSSTLT